MSQQETKAYIDQLTPQEQKVLKIAMEHLETSFNLTKSIGFKEWQAQQAQAQQAQAQQPTGRVEIKPISEILLPLQSKL
jgi:hypothetical protein